MEELNKYSKTNPFGVPENYFEDFEGKLSYRIEVQKYDKDAKWRISNLKPYFAVAAGFLLLFALWFTFLSKLDFERTAANQENAEQDVIFSFFESTDSDELIQLIASDETFAQEFSIHENDIDIIIEDLDESLIMNEIENNDTTDNI
ncbi:MAG: hypothetical protein HC831_15840 [Chloroflexia bacterium]|nr:hypothetical protein [Chloroflexia bacterium]